MRVLVVEDDRHVARPLCAALRDHGYEVTWVATGEEALRPHAADLVLLDLRLPGISGIEVCRRLRRSCDVPIIILTALDGEQDTLRGFRAEADDFVTKPFSVRVVIARIEAVMRRVRAAKVRQWQIDAPKVVELDRLVIDVARREVHVDGTVVTLAPKEFDILARLAREPGTVVPTKELLDDVWQGQGGTSKALAVHVANLRRKLGSAVDIQTVRGVGHRLVPT